MKKTILAIAMLLCCWSANAQFVLTDKGLRNEKDKSLDYYIIDCGDKQQVELFNSLMFYFTTQYNSSRERVNPDTFSVTFNGLSRGAIVDGKKLFRVVYDLNYNIMFDVKDGKIRVWAPMIREIYRLEKQQEPEHAGVNDAHRHPREHRHERTYLYISPNYTGSGMRQYTTGAATVYNKGGGVKRRVAKKSIETYFNDMVGSIQRYLGGGSDW